MSESESYVCGICEGEFQGTMSDEEALAEYRERWPGPVGEMAIVCEDCYEQVMAWWSGLSPLEQSRIQSDPNQN